MVTIGNKRLTIGDFRKVLYENSDVELQPESLEKVRACCQFVKGYAKDKVIYGINTGLGPMAQYKIREDEQQQLQYNLIRSHASGSGELFSEELARATLLARLNCFMLGSSGVHEQAVVLMASLLNEGINPCIFYRGGVGASGDLVQLAHLALNLIGEGEVWYQGKIESAEKVFSDKKIQPLQIHLREGIAMMNGTSAMTGVGIVNLIHAQQLLRCSVMLSSIINELMKSFDDHYSTELNHLKHHQGQQKIAEEMRRILNDSKLIRKRPDHVYHRKIEEAHFTDKVQEYYSVRCVPQILGPVYDTIERVKQVLEDEVNSVNDNPVIDHTLENVYHGGNFHGDYVSLEMDKLKIVIVKLSMLAERQLNYLLNEKLNQKLPPFINLGKLGLNFGMQGMQFTATSATAENQTLSFPMYVHSIPNNNDNQDIVSMGCNAALITKKVIDNTFDVLAIQTIAVMQAIDYLKCQARLSPSSNKVYKEFRAVMPAFIEDHAKYKDLQAARTFIFQLDTDSIF